MRTLFKLTLLVFVGALIAGALMMVQRTKESPLTSFDQWPDVPQNPAA